MCAYNERSDDVNEVTDDERASNLADSIQCGDVGHGGNDLADIP